jgi:polar amino acid transport system substrate-binding protein
LFYGVSAGFKKTLRSDSQGPGKPMEQLTQKLKDGAMQIIEVPAPRVQPGMVLVRNYYSLISAGTEGSSVKAARKGYLGKARERPEQLRQVLDMLKTHGPVQTYRTVMKKLDAYSPLGYSCVGEVIGLPPDENSFSLGDFVACGGLSACHAEIVSIPVNLCVKLQRDTDLKQAAYNTMGAICLHGIRQADLRLGETCAVIGMGLLGQLTAILLRASGVRVVGIDIDPGMVEFAGRHCADLTLCRDDAGIDGKIMRFTNSLGCDAVIITAASTSLDPVNFAGAISRKRGTIVVVGAVPTGFDREPHFYKKELQIRMSCSYGPGRYDRCYEEKGVDYPVAYVRWTENRNMQAFQDLIYTGRVDLSPLTTHVLKLSDAPAAYDMMLQSKEPFIGIIIEYDHKPEKPISTRVFVKHSPSTAGPIQVSIGFIGAGSYAQSHLLPNVPKEKGILLKGVMTATGTGSRSVGERFGFEFCTTNEDDILENDLINTVFIASRHDSHAEYVRKALQAGKHVFVEKPLCLHEEELNGILRLYRSGNGSWNRANLLSVGYNRRFSSLAEIMKSEFGGCTMSMIYRINAGFIPADSWIQDPELGGGRIIGELCHFVDFLTFMNGSLPTSVYAVAMHSANHPNDTLTVSLVYGNGSIGAICYFANGDRALPKERIEVYANGCTGILDDFQRLHLYLKGRKKEKKLLSREKGQSNEIRAFIKAVCDGKEGPIPFDEIYSASLVTFKIIESIRSGQPAAIQQRMSDLGEK